MCRKKEQQGCNWGLVWWCVCMQARWCVVQAHSLPYCLHPHTPICQLEHCTQAVQPHAAGTGWRACMQARELPIATHLVQKLVVALWLTCVCASPGILRQGVCQWLLGVSRERVGVCGVGEVRVRVRLHENSGTHPTPLAPSFCLVHIPRHLSTHRTITQQGRHVFGHLGHPRMDGWCMLALPTLGIAWCTRCVRVHSMGKCGG